MKRKTAATLALIVFILSFFLTPLGDLSKSLLMRSFSSPPDIIAKADQERLSGYDWRLKNQDGKLFNFERSKGKVVMIDFWATWHTPSTAELRDLHKLYDAYKDKVDFYIVTNEESSQVVEFMEKKNYSFPVTFRITDEPAPFEIPEPSGAYIIDKKGNMVVKSKEIQDWYNDQVIQLLDSLILQ